jgi:hypothetical protein
LIAYLDTSVVLAQLLAEDRAPPEALWEAPLVSSRLLEYECWVRLHARGLGPSHGSAARELLGRVTLIELVPEVLARALEPFPAPVRTLDALHLATLDHLRRRGDDVGLASLDLRLVSAAKAMRIPAHR